jgi:Raf kinase inhibitor-like YbhB/YbcL family protein
MEIEGLNDFHTNAYQGPCPDTGTHRYVFHCYALDILPALPCNSKADKVLHAIRERIIGYGNITALYKRK